MKTRFFTSFFIIAVYALVFIGIIYLDKIIFDIFVLILMLCAGFEMCKALSKKFSPPMVMPVLINCVLGYAGFFTFKILFGAESALGGYLAVLCLIAAACIIYGNFSKRYTVRNAVTTVLVLIYPVTLMFYMLNLNYLSFNGPGVNVTAIALMFLISTFSDTFAYFVGSALKGPKLCPSISPKKTVSGAIGGLIGGVAGAMIVMGLAYTGTDLVSALSASGPMNVILYIVAGLIGSMFTQLGDLLASYIKRKCGVKDFGNLLPGHGGILDRIDGFILNAVFLYIYFLAIAY